VTPPRQVVIAGAAAISAHGASWRGLGEALLAGGSLPGVPAETPLANPKARNARKMMSRGAYLAAAALGDLMRDVGWTAEQRESAGYFLGVGASGGSLDDVTSLLDASLISDGESTTFSLPAFGEHGLAACNPLLAFQLMNNFTLAHGAIFEGLGGPNSALFSRGSGTTHALIEAVHAIRAGDCDHAIAGGADSATHPVTHAELVREGFVERGLVPAEGAALVALASLVVASPAVASSDAALGSRAAGSPAVASFAPAAIIEGCAIASCRGSALVLAIADAVERAFAEAGGASTACGEPTPFDVTAPTTRGFGDVDVVVIAPWGSPVAGVATSWARERFPTAVVVDTSALGATLAASPALAWVAAIDMLATRRGRPLGAQRAIVIDIGVDDEIGAVVLRSHTPRGPS
jgi:3-oxoacyl-(acyl-carrier-protein) synthase